MAPLSSGQLSAPDRQGSRPRHRNAGHPRQRHERHWTAPTTRRHHPRLLNRRIAALVGIGIVGCGGLAWGALDMVSDNSNEKTSTTTVPVFPPNPLTPSSSSDDASAADPTAEIPPGAEAPLVTNPALPAGPSTADPSPSPRRVDGPITQPDPQHPATPPAQNDRAAPTTAPTISTPTTSTTSTTTTPAVITREGVVNGCNTYGENCNGNPIYEATPPEGYDWSTWPTITTVDNGTTLTARCWAIGGMTYNYRVDPLDLGPDPYESNVYFNVQTPDGRWGWIPDTYFVRDRTGQMGLDQCPDHG